MVDNDDGNYKTLVKKIYVCQNCIEKEKGKEKKTYTRTINSDKMLKKKS